MNSTCARLGRLRKRMWKAQKGLCHLCGEVMAISKTRSDEDSYATFDHLLPRSKGGTGAQENIKLAHKRCNVKRGNKPLPGYQLRRRDVVGTQKGVGLATLVTPAMED